MSPRLIRWIRNLTIGAVATGVAVYSSTFVVYPGEVAILYNRITGIRDTKVYREGMHFRILGIDDPKVFNARLRPRVLNTMTGTKDLQMVNIRLRVLFRPISEHLPYIYRHFGLDYDERVLPSVSNEILKAVIAEYNAEELIKKRDQVSSRIAELMVKKVKDQFFIDIVDLSLMDLQFGKDFMTAVESKQVAQQEAEKYRYVVLESEQKKQASIIRAEGEAESARMIAEAMKSSGTGLLALRKIEAAVDIADQLVGAPNVNFVPISDRGILLNMKMN